MKEKNRYLPVLLLACVVIFFVNLDAIFVNIMEARNFVTAREMIDFDHWIFTTLNNEPRYEKPPLPTWLTALSMLLFDSESLLVLRLPAAILGSLTVFMVYKMAQRITRSERYALISGLIAVTSFYILYSGRDGQWDIHTHGFMLAGIYFMYRFLENKGKVLLNAAIAGIFLGCSFLSKGPVSMYALWLPFLISYGIVFKYDHLKDLWKPILLMLFTAFLIAAPWSLYVYLFDTQAVDRITDKESGRWLDYNVRPFWYYWSFFIQSGIWTIPAFVGLLYPYLKQKVFHLKAYRFTILWTALSVLLLSVIPEKKSRYLLPVLIPLALNTGFYIEYLFRNYHQLKMKEKWFVYFNFGLIAFICLAVPIGLYIYLQEIFSEIVWWYLGLSITLVGIGIMILKYLKTNHFSNVFYLTICFIAAIIIFGLPMANFVEKNPDYRGTEVIKRSQAKKNVPVYEFSSFTPELIYDYGKPITRFTNNRDSILFPQQRQFLLLASKDQQDRFDEVLQDYTLEKIDSVDINPVGNKFKDRLYRDVFLVNKTK